PRQDRGPRDSAGQGRGDAVTGRDGTRDVARAATPRRSGMPFGDLVSAINGAPTGRKAGRHH
ncbi:MAG TPA: hypothetical protein VGE72_06010, partial [Azospirillum sp.]